MGYDEYNNRLVTLELQENKTFLYKEKFLDGSELEDSGEWSMEKQMLVLESDRKTRRFHQMTTYPKEYKFKGEKFLVKEERIEYMWTNKRNANQYMMKYTFRKVD